MRLTHVTSVQYHVSLLVKSSKSTFNALRNKGWRALKCRKESKDRRWCMRGKLLNKSSRKYHFYHCQRHLLILFSALNCSKMQKRFIYKEERSCRLVSEHRLQWVRKLTKNQGPSPRWLPTLKYSIVHFYPLDFSINNNHSRIATKNKQLSWCWNSHIIVSKTLQTPIRQPCMISYLTEYNS